MKLLRAILVALLIWLQIVPSFAAPRFWVGGTNTWDNASTTPWSATSGGGGGQSAPTSADTCTFDAASGGGTVTVNANVQCSTFTWGAFTGTIDFATNNNSPTFGILNGSGTGTRTFNCGSGTFTINATTGTVFDVTTGTGLTLSCASVIVTVSATPTGTRGIGLGNGRTFGTFNLIAGGNTGFYLDVSAGVTSTITNLNLTAPLVLRFANTTTYTITNAFNWAGTGFNSGFIIIGANTAPIVSVASGNPTISWGAISGVSFTGGATFTANNSIGWGNSGITINGPGGARCIGC